MITMTTRTRTTTPLPSLLSLPPLATTTIIRTMMKQKQKCFAK